MGRRLCLLRMPKQSLRVRRSDAEVTKACRLVKIWMEDVSGPVEREWAATEF